MTKFVVKNLYICLSGVNFWKRRPNFVGNMDGGGVQGEGQISCYTGAI